MEAALGGQIRDAHVLKSPFFSISQNRGRTPVGAISSRSPQSAVTPTSMTKRSDRLVERLCFTVLEHRQQCQAAFALTQRDQRLFLPSTDDGIQLPVANARATFHDRGALVDRGAVAQRSARATVRAAAFAAQLLAAQAPVGGQVASRPLSCLSTKEKYCSRVPAWLPACPPPEEFRWQISSLN